MYLRSVLSTAVLSTALLSGFYFSPAAEQEAYASPFRGDSELQLHFGALRFDREADLGRTQRFLGGTQLKWNFTPRGRLLTGFSLGALYSSLGAERASFFGKNGNDAFDGEQLWTFPINFHAGGVIFNTLFLGVHGGASLVHQTDAGVINLGRDNPAGDTEWEFFPNVGFNVGLPLGSGASFQFRGDAIMTSGVNLYSGTFALSFAL